MKSRIKLTYIASSLAFVIAAMAIVSGGQVLFGKYPCYYVIDWLPVYNSSMGVITFFLTAILIWKDHKASLIAACITLVPPSGEIPIFQLLHCE